MHERLYAVTFEVPVELVALRVIATGATREVTPSKPEGPSAGDEVDAMIGREPAFFDGTWSDIPHYDRDRLPVGASMAGPAIIHQYDTTTVLLPQHRAEIDPHGNILIWPIEKAN
jgi:N-methylhydantoinase A